MFFFPLCNLRCPWCHNRDLVLGLERELISIEQGLSHLKKRVSVLGGVVLSGGEPCLWDELPEIISEIKKIKDGNNRTLAVKLDTNGMFPDMLKTLFSRGDTRPDYIALDLKIAPSRYIELLPGSLKGEAPGSAFESPGDALIRSASILRDSGITHEYRTLALPPPFTEPEQKPPLNGPCAARYSDFITKKDIEALSPLAMDNAPWYFRPFRGGNCLDPAWDSLEENAEEAAARAEKLAETARMLGKNGIYVSRPS